MAITGAPNGPKLTPGAILTEIPRFVIDQAMGALKGVFGVRTPGPIDVSNQNAPQSPAVQQEMRQLGAQMPRNRREPWFGPGQPMQALAPRGDVAGRARDYPVAINLGLTPRQYEGINFPMLRGLFEGLDLAKICVETRKNQMAKLSWEIMPRMKPGQTVRQKDDPRCAQLESFFRSPDRKNNWDVWMRKILHEMMVIDAPAIYVRRTLGGDVYSLEVIDGADIIPRLDKLGRTPAPPEIAYTHVLKGVAAVNYTSDELIYFPRNLRAGRLYGQSPIEQICMTIQIAIRREINKLQFWCYSEDTEVLTRRGWLRFDETVAEDEFATRRIGSAEFEWQKKTSSFHKHYTGDLLHIKGRSIDLKVTPHHRMLICDRDGSNERVVLAEDLAAEGLKKIAVPVGYSWVGEEIGEKTFQFRKAKPATISFVKPVAYDAPVVCVSVPNTFLYVRRNGKACWSGNTEGNIPDALIGTPDSWTPQQIRDMQEMFDAWTSDQANRRKAYFIPGGTNYNPTRPAQTLDPQQDEWLARVITYAFNLPNLPLVNQQNRATAETANDAALREGLAPNIVWLKGLMDYIITHVFGFDDIEWVMDNYREEEPADLSTRQLAELKAGCLSIDEYRAERGLPGFGLPAIVFGIGPLGFMSVDDIKRAIAQGLTMPQAPMPMDASGAAGLPFDPSQAAPPGGPPALPGPPGQMMLAAPQKPLSPSVAAAIKAAPAVPELANHSMTNLPPELLHAVGLKPDYRKAASPAGDTRKPGALPSNVIQLLHHHESKYKQAAGK